MNPYCLDHIDIQHLSARTNAKVRWYTGLMDTICPPSSQFAAYNHITAQKEMIIYPDHGHEDLPDKDDQVFEYMMDL